jgi:hypothetical protein
MSHRRPELHAVLQSIPLDSIVRIDLGLEGDWSASVVSIWSRREGFLGFDRVVRSHTTHRPSLELYFDGAWVGVHCFTREDGSNVFDQAKAEEVIGWIEESVARTVDP